MQVHLQQRLRQASKARAKLAAVAVAGLASAPAWAGYNVGTGGGTTWAQFRTWIQAYIDFMDGPFGTAAVVLSIVIGFAVWIFAPKEGIMGVLVRAAIAGMVILNVATWMGSFTG